MIPLVPLFAALREVPYLVGLLVGCDIFAVNFRVAEIDAATEARSSKVPDDDRVVHELRFIQTAAEEPVCMLIEMRIELVHRHAP